MSLARVANGPYSVDSKKSSMGVVGRLEKIGLGGGCESKGWEWDSRECMRESAVL